LCGRSASLVELASVAPASTGEPAEPVDMPVAPAVEPVAPVDIPVAPAVEPAAPIGEPAPAAPALPALAVPEAPVVPVDEPALPADPPCALVLQAPRARASQGTHRRRGEGARFMDTSLPALETGASSRSRWSDQSVLFGWASL
jgi:hypothetical protein